MSAAAQTWATNPDMRARLLAAAEAMPVPLLLIQPELDADVSPGYALGQALQHAGKTYGLLIIPPYGTPEEQGHCFGGRGDIYRNAEAITFPRQELDLDS